jgi:hypothetical protein
VLNTAGGNLAGSDALFSRTGWASLVRQPSSSTPADRAAAAAARAPAGMV